MQERSRKLRNASMIVDIVHIVIGVLIVVMAIVSFLNPQDHIFLFPVIFFLAGLLNLINGTYKIKMNKRKNKKKAAGVAGLLFGGLLFALAVISAITIWWG